VLLGSESGEFGPSPNTNFETMSELEEAWAAELAKAEARARMAGRTDIAEYLALRGSNDLLRNTGSSWLLDLFLTVAGEANRAGAAIQISREDAHRFKLDHAAMIGPRLVLESGLRKIIVEVGWPRAPRDGFIRGGGLACGNINHVGMKHVSQQLRLLLTPSGSPQWIAYARSGQHGELHEADVRRHVSILLDDKRYPRIHS
jgi:hypothetical protein